MNKTAVITGPGEIELRESPIPRTEDDQVLVKVRSVGICTWEQAFFKGISKGYPFIGGHEICGEVVETGKDVQQNLKPGDRVVVASLIRCGECRNCRKGYDNICLNAFEQTTPGEPWGPGGFSHYFTAKGYEVYKVSDTTDFSVGTLAEPLACVIHSLDRSRLEIGDTAVILGAGVMGLLHLLLARQRGAKVIVSEPDSLRREKAMELGAEAALDPLSGNLKEEIYKINGNRGADAVFFTAGGTPALQEGITLLDKNGTLVVYGGIKPSKDITIDPMTFHYDEIYITGVTKHTKDSFRRAAEILSSGSLPLSSLITQSLPFSDVKNAFDKAGSQQTYRITLEMQK